MKYVPTYIIFWKHYVFVEFYNWTYSIKYGLNLTDVHMRQKIFFSSYEVQIELI
jgi:hypothetical protein